MQAYPYFQQQQQQQRDRGSGSTDLRRRRGQGPSYTPQPDYSSFYDPTQQPPSLLPPVLSPHHFQPQADFSSISAKSAPKKRVGLCLPANYKRTAVSCLSRRSRVKSSNWTSYTDDMPKTPKRIRSPQDYLPVNQLSSSLIPSNYGYPSQPQFGYQAQNQLDYSYPQMPLVHHHEEDEEEDSDSIFPKTTGQQRMKIGLALLMIPSLIVILSSQKKFKSESNTNIDLAALKAGGFGGLGGMGGGGAPGIGGGMGGQGNHLEGLAGMDRDMGMSGHRSHGRGNRRKQKNRRGSPYHDRMRAFRGIEDELHDENDEDGGNEEGEMDEEDRDPYNDQLDELLDREPHEEAMNDMHEPKEDNNSTPATETADTMEITLEPEKRPEIDDYYAEERGNREQLLYGMMNPSFQGLVYPESPAPQGNPDPGLVVESETLDPLLLQGNTDPPTPSDMEASVAQLHEKGFKIILAWSNQTALTNALPGGIKGFTESNCQACRCVVTSDRQNLPIADAIVYHLKDNDLPPERKEWQLLIVHIDQPLNASQLKSPDIPFKWTWSYRRDSDIVQSPGLFELNTKASPPEPNLVASRMFDVWRNKRRMVMLWQDNCTSIPFVESLKKHIDVDIFGKCGKPMCHGQELTSSPEECFKKKVKNYLFVLPTESSTCTQLLTTKVVAALQTYSVPVILSAANMSALSPPQSVIYSHYYKSTKDLADYLNDIGTDFNKYRKFMDWKRRYSVVNQRKDLCKLCTMLHTNTVNDQRTDLKAWINKDGCPARRAG